MTLSEGTKLGAYEIVGPLGAGGMGEVYRARDPRLGRDVAIKVTSERFSERFELEARAVASLNHPNICQLYDVGPNYLVMELVDGAPIVQAESPRKLLDLAVQIADGLAAAHAAGVIHRDLKPDNIFVAGPASSNPGQVKILDFGLAKMASAVPADLENSPTRVSALTDPGSTVGTVHYMSPEQARGETNLSAQSDQFSFGLVLYEIVTGKRAFERASAAEIMTAIIRENAGPLPAATPAPLRWVIERLLSKDPSERYDSTRDLYRELRQIRERLSESVTSVLPGLTPVPRAKSRIIPMLAIIAAALAIGAVATLLLLPPPRVNLAAFTFTPLSRMDATERAPVFSPDGKSIVFTANIRGIDQVFTKVIDPSPASEAAQITHAPLSCFDPFWSPDGSRIYFHSDNKLWSIPPSGGTATEELANAVNVTMHPDGKTVAFNRTGKLWVDSLGSNQPREFGQAPFPNERAGGAQFSPDGSKLLAASGEEYWILDYPSGAARKAPSGGSQFFNNLRRWHPDSRHTFEIEGNPANFNSKLVLVDTANGRREYLYVAGEVITNAALSRDGQRLAYIRGLVEWNVLEISLPSGFVRTTLSGSGTVSWWPDWARSGTHFLATTNRNGPFVVEDVSSTEGFSRRLYGDSEEVVINARWSPDGSRFAVVTAVDQTRRVELRIANSSGGRATKLIDQNIDAASPLSWSPDGQWIAYAQINPPGIARIRADSGSPPVVLIQPAVADRARWGNYQHVEWSPAGNWIAYPSAQGISLVSPDTKMIRLLTTRKLVVFGFSKDGSRMFGIERDTTGKGPQWQLYQIDVANGVDKLLGPVDLPVSANALAGFSMHPDGTRFLTSIAKWPLDIWMMEGFNPPKTWIARVLGR